MMPEDLTVIYANSFKENWDLPALTDYGDPKSTITYGEFARRIARLHIFFESQGIKPGDKIALCGRNTTTWVTVFIATITYGAVIVPVLQDFNPQDTQHILNHSEAMLLFVSNSIYENLDFDELPEIKAILSLDSRRVLAERQTEGKNQPSKVLKNLTRKLKTRYRQGFSREDVNYIVPDKDAMAVLNYTSGTTGYSKGVMLSYNNLTGNVVFGEQVKIHFQGSRVLSFLPLAHAYGCAFDMLTPLAVGSHITLLGRLPSPKVLLKAMQDVKPNLIVTVPLILEKIYKNQIVPMITKQAMRWALAIPLLDKAIYAKIRNRLVEALGGQFEEVIVGGAPLNKEVEEFLYRIKFPFTVGYGMTECAPLISYTPWRQFVPESCGRTLPIMQSKIVSDDPENIPGEICTRGENVMKGYYKNPEATSAVLDEEGWLHTGDMGVRTPDGTLFIKGRYKTMILSATGQNIYPEEIESKLNNMPYVNESLVVERGKGLAAIVYPDYEQMDRDKLALTDMDPIMENVRLELNKLVAPYERIDQIQIIPNEFQKTPKRSIKRYLYR